MSPAKRRDMRQKLWWTVVTGLSSLSDGTAKAISIPIDDDGREQI